MEGDPSQSIVPEISKSFQSTPSAWRETEDQKIVVAFLGISIHSLRMEGDREGCSHGVCSKISIHSLRMEGDSSAI